MMRSAISGRARSIASNVLPSITSRRDVDAHDGGRRARPRVEDRHLAEELAGRQHREHALGLADLAADLDLARLDDVHVVARLALLEQHRARLEVAREPLQPVVHVTASSTSSHGCVAKDVQQRAASDLRGSRARRRAARPRRTYRPSLTARTSISTSQPSPRSRMPSATSAGNLSARTGPTPDQRWRYTVSIRPSDELLARRLRRPASMPRTSSTPRVDDRLDQRRGPPRRPPGDRRARTRRRRARAAARRSAPARAGRPRHSRRSARAARARRHRARSRRCDRVDARSTTTTERIARCGSSRSERREARRMIARRHDDIDQRSQWHRLWYTSGDGAHLQGRGGRYRRRQRAGRAHQAAREGDHAARGARRHRRVRGAVPDPDRRTRSRSSSAAPTASAPSSRPRSRRTATTRSASTSSRCASTTCSSPAPSRCSSSITSRPARSTSRPATR